VVMVFGRRELKRDTPRTRAAWALPGAAAAALALLAVSPSQAAHPRDEELLQVLSANPIYELAADGVKSAAPPGASKSKPAAFSYHFETPSKQSKTKYEGLPGLKKGKKYNVVLYFIESTAAMYLDVDRDGKAVAPILKQMQKKALVFENHYANYPRSANAMLNVLA